MKISKHAVVTLDYTLKDDEGAIIDQSQKGHPLAYLHGVGGLIPGLESELESKEKGDKLNVSVAPEEAYGVRDEKQVVVVSKDNFQGTEKLTVGMQVHMENKKGRRIARVTDIKGKDVTLDLNHPLAGMNLHFNVEVLEVRAATAEEISHGHVHGPGGHHHH